jgi:hypothetical protein
MLWDYSFQVSLWKLVVAFWTACLDTAHIEPCFDMSGHTVCAIPAMLTLETDSFGGRDIFTTDGTCLAATIEVQSLR